MSHYTQRLSMFYRPGMAPTQAESFSKSPTKPRRFMEFLRGTPVWPHVDVREDWKPVTERQILTAHAPEYVAAFTSGAWVIPPGHYESLRVDEDNVMRKVAALRESNGVEWSEEFRDSVLLTNGSLLAAIRQACDDPGTITMSPTSGFHHAHPDGGDGFCTFSGQVIAGLELYRSRGKVGAWIDLDGHYGNSIDDSMTFAPGLHQAIPVNINPRGTHGAYLEDLRLRLRDLGKMVLDGRIDYLCFAHGADSHEWDSLGSQCTTEEWLRASRMVYEAIDAWSSELGRPIPVTLALFGGYRDDHPDSVLGLHAMDTARALHWLGGVKELATYQAEVLPRRGR